MNFKNTSLVITSIAGPNRAMKLFAEESKKRGIDFIVIGDEISPVEFKLDGCRFYSLDEQKVLPFKLAKILPTRHYSRKNIGYLLSAHQELILETDDDNIPRENFWESRNRKVTSKLIENNGWTNAYSYFTDENIWPRGFPLEYIADKKKKVADPTEDSITPIQQGLADENPDVDAIYRMCMKLPISFLNHQPIALGKNSWCPFNSQNTSWFREAFPLLYLPSYCSFRMTDIWRSFIAQRIAWTCEWNILFHGPSVWQERNEHSLIKDFEDEVQGYLCNAKICSMLGDLDLKQGIKNIPDNLIHCYKALVDKNYLLPEEMKLLEAWLIDIKSIQS